MSISSTPNTTLCHRIGTSLLDLADGLFGAATRDTSWRDFFDTTADWAYRAGLWFRGELEDYKAWCLEEGFTEDGKLPRGGGESSVTH